MFRKSPSFVSPRKKWPDETTSRCGVSMDESKRDVVRTTKALIGSLTIKYSVVCQEGCYPDKKKHANQDAFCASAMHGGESLLLGVFDGHGQEGSRARRSRRIFSRRF